MGQGDVSLLVLRDADVGTEGLGSASGFWGEWTVEGVPGVLLRDCRVILEKVVVQARVQGGGWPSQVFVGRWSCGDLLPCRAWGRVEWGLRMC